MEEIREKYFGTRALLDDAELDALESEFSEGLSSGEIVDVFCGRGIRFSEATFRKYVQLGLLPRSTRVGTKGKHKGSKGVYPVGALRQINEIKRMMALDYTIEEIRLEFAFVGGELEELRRLLKNILRKLEESVAAERGGDLRAINARKQVEEAKRSVEQLLAVLEATARSIRENAHFARDAV
jgi:hypothetical protein